MSYICEMCQKVVPKNTPRRTIVVYRKSPSHKGDEIVREIAVCHPCSSGGKSEDELTHNEQDVPEPKPVVLCCDVCGEPIGDEGQVTVEGVLCKQHIPSREKGKGRGRSKKFK